MTWFDESRLDDDGALAAADIRLRALAESGARVRREFSGASDAIDLAVEAAPASGRPRAVIAAGPGSRLLRAVLEPTCPVPFVAWPHPGLPGWAGSLDLVVVLAPDGDDPGAASAVAEAGRRGCSVVAACPPDSLVANHAGSRDTVVIPSGVQGSTDQVAVAVVMLTVLARSGLGPATDAESVATALDDVAVSCSPHRELTVNPAKVLSIALGDATPVLWGGSVLAARAARRVAESLRRVSGRSAIAGEEEQLLPVLEATGPRDVFDDPVADGGARLRPVLLLLDDGGEDPVLVDQRRHLTETADERGVRVEVVSSVGATDVARYASLVLQGQYTAEYLGLGLVD